MIPKPARHEHFKIFSGVEPELYLCPAPEPDIGNGYDVA